MLLTDVQQQTLDRLLMENGNTELLPELIYDAPEFLNQIDEKLRDVDEYYHTKDYIYECDDGKQEIYQSMDGGIEQYRVCKVL